MTKTKEQLEQELADALAARDAAEQKVQQAEIEKAEALKEKEAAKQEAEDSKLKTEELLKAAAEAEKASEKEAEAFLKDDDNDAEMISVRFPALRGKDADKDIVLIVNGKAWQIQRGVEVEIPKYLYEVYLCSELAKDEAAEFIEENTSN